MLEVVARWLYSAFVWVVQPLLRRKLSRRGRSEPGYREAVEERFGCYGSAGSQGWLWVHAVSLGETRAAALLLARLRALRPDLRVLLTHGTATGREAGAALLRPGDVQAWLPWDTPAAVARFLGHFRPRVGVLMETEVWPNLVAGCRRAGVPLLLVNARLNERSFQQARRWRSLSRPAYGGLSAAYAQTASDAERLGQLGAPVEGVYGNLKFDVPTRSDSWAQGRRWRAALGARPVWMWASSREGEEALWLASWGRCQTTGAWPSRLQDQPLWLVVPRHPQRFDAVERLLLAQGLRVFRCSGLDRSRIGELPPEALEADVWLGDSVGEMPFYYGLSDLALLGGSYLPLGGQNLIEAAACDCPVIMGPHTYNFAEAASLAEEVGAAVRVADMDAALSQIGAWVDDPYALSQARAACRALLDRGAGASDRYAAAVLDWFTSPAAR